MKYFVAVRLWTFIYCVIPCCALSVQPLLNPLPNDKFLDRSKFKTFADDKINVT